MNAIMEEDRPLAETQWYDLNVLKQRRAFEVRLMKKWYHKASGSWKNTWILCCCGHEENEDGSVKSVMGCITDKVFKNRLKTTR